MLKFFITTNDGQGAVRDDEGLEFADAKAAIDDAQRALAEIALDLLPNGPHADFNVKVEDAAGNEIYRASLAFNGQRIEDVSNADNQHNADAASRRFQD